MPRIYFAQDSNKVIYQKNDMNSYQDADLPPIMEEEEPEVPFGFKQQPTADKHIPGYIEPTGDSGSCPMTEELPTIPENEERALVLFRPMSTPLLLSPSNFSVSVNSDIIAGIKSKHLFPVSEFGALILLLLVDWICRIHDYLKHVSVSYCGSKTAPSKLPCVFRAGHTI